MQVSVNKLASSLCSKPLNVKGSYGLAGSALPQRSPVFPAAADFYFGPLCFLVASLTCRLWADIGHVIIPRFSYRIFGSACFGNDPLGAAGNLVLRSVSNIPALPPVDCDDSNLLSIAYIIN